MEEFLTPEYSEEPEAEEALYVISVAAKLAEMHPQTLRMYERRGLIHPKRTKRRVRMYSKRDIERLKLIQTFTQELGLNLAGVEVALNLLDKLEKLKSELAETRARLKFVMEQYQQLAERKED